MFATTNGYQKDAKVLKNRKNRQKTSKIEQKLLHGKHFQSGGKQAAKGFDRACRKRLFGLATVGALVCRSAALSPISICSRIRFDRAVFVALCLWLCMFLRFCAYGAVGCQGFLLLLVALIDRYRCYGVMLMALRAFCAFMFAVYGSLYFCAVGVACRSGVMFLLLSFSAASSF